MKEFMFVYRSTVTDVKPSPEQMQQVMTDWMNWLGSIAAQNKLVDRGNRLTLADSKTVAPGNVVTDGPFTEIKEYISGYSLIKAADLNEAATIAQGCPILKMGGKVDVRTIISPEGK